MNCLSSFQLFWNIELDCFENDEKIVVKYIESGAPVEGQNVEYEENGILVTNFILVKILLNIF